MGIRGHIQTTQPEYDGACISYWISHAAYRYLSECGVTIYTDDNGEDADRWEIEIANMEELKEIAKHLHEHPEELDKYFKNGDEDLKGRGEELAKLLDCGICVAEKKDYSTIVIDWF